MLKRLFTWQLLHVFYAISLHFPLPCNLHSISWYQWRFQQWKQQNKLSKTFLPQKIFHFAVVENTPKSGIIKFFSTFLPLFTLAICCCSAPNEHTNENNEMKSLIVLGKFYELSECIISICGHCVIIDYLNHPEMGKCEEVSTPIDGGLRQSIGNIN